MARRRFGALRIIASPNNYPSARSGPRTKNARATATALPKVCPDVKEGKDTEMKRAPVQGDRWLPHGTKGRENGTITWEEHLEIYEAYVKKWGCSDQSAERIAERAGFGYGEIIDLTGQPPKTWQENDTETDLQAERHG